MRVPVIRGTIERRILVNYRVRPETLAALLPAPFQPQLVNGWGVAGICLIRLAGIRPRFVPVPCGLSSENAAHRIAVQWQASGTVRQGVYVPRRDTSLWLNAVVGGRLFPGVHHRAAFAVRESDASYSVRLQSLDGHTRVAIDAEIGKDVPSGSVFCTLAVADAFFRGGSLGYSVSRRAGVFDGLELRAVTWRLEPLAVRGVSSSFFEDPDRFPPGTAYFDSAFVMRNVEHEWHARESLCSPSPEAAA